MKTISLTQGKVALVDDENFEWLSQFKWYARKHILKNRTNWYAVRNITVASGKQKTVQMHRIIAAVAGFPQIDHRDGNGLNNQRENLRPATCRQNQHNQRKRISCSSKFKGVCWDRQNGKWRADIRLPGYRLHLGLFEEDAAKAYDKAARQLFGEFSFTNEQLASN
jgi:hypothetical protein